jgi:predicted RNA binding protein YcfA (HicA-like mRNA interferase family)
MPLKYNELQIIINDLSFDLVRKKWSHFRYEKNWYWLTIPYHNEFNKKTAKSILKDISSISNVDYKILIKKYNIKI